MATFDVRKDVAATTTCILFADETVGSTHVAYQLTRFGGEHVVIGDSANDEVLLHSKQHALDAIKAIQKAIELGWLK